MNDGFWTAFGASLLAAAVTATGIATIRRFAGWGERNTPYFMAFAAGVLIAASFLHIIPKAFTMNPDAPAWLLTGFFGLYLFNRFVTAFVCARVPDADEPGLGLVPTLGIGFHSLVDGAISSITYTVSIFTGVVATFGMVLHEFPEGIITYLLLRRGGFSEPRAALFAFCAAALTTPVGVLVSWPLLRLVTGEMLGALLALSAGALVYVGASHLLPRAEREHGRFTLVALAGGILVAVLIVFSKGA